jgi:hypothetical protein
MAREWRTIKALSIDAEHDADGADKGPPVSFALYCTERHEYRPRVNASWHEDFSQTRRERIADGITRRQLSELIADGADWLTYLGDGDLSYMEVSK